jgi:hypothetical protein
MNRDVARLTDGRVEKLRRVYSQHGQPWPLQHEAALREHMLSYEYGKFRTGDALQWFIAYVKSSAVYYDVRLHKWKLPIPYDPGYTAVTGRWSCAAPQIQNIPSSDSVIAMMKAIAASFDTTTTKGNTMKVSFIQAGRTLFTQAAASAHIHTFSTPLTIRVTDDAGNSSERCIQSYNRITHQRADDIVSDAVAALKAAHLKQFPAKYTNQAAKDEAVRVAKVKLEHAQRTRSAASVALVQAETAQNAAVAALTLATAKGVAFDGPDFLIERCAMVVGNWNVVHQPSGMVTVGLPSYKGAEQLVKQRQDGAVHPSDFLPKYLRTLSDGRIVTG